MLFIAAETSTSHYLWTNEIFECFVKWNVLKNQTCNSFYAFESWNTLVKRQNVSKGFNLVTPAGRQRVIQTSILSGYFWLSTSLSCYHFTLQRIRLSYEVIDIKHDCNHLTTFELIVYNLCYNAFETVHCCSVNYCFCHKEINTHTHRGRKREEQKYTKMIF